MPLACAVPRYVGLSSCVDNSARGFWQTRPPCVGHTAGGAARGLNRPRGGYLAGMAADNWTRGDHPSDPAEGARDIGTPPRQQADAEPHTAVQQQDLRALLDTEDDGARLVLQEGRIQLRTGSAGEDTTGAVSVISRAELRNRLAGAVPDARRLADQAVELNTEISSLGA